MVTIRNIILLALTILMMIGCDIAMDSLDITNGSKFIVKSKTKEKQTYLYRLIEVGDSWYDYNYRDITNFEVGDTLIINVNKTTAYGNNQSIYNYHRLVHAYIDGRTQISGVIIRKDQWPEPDYDETKSCRNMWKPSDEQINTLEQWLKDNQYKGDARYCYTIFESLYHDLKKLKG